MSNSISVVYLSIAHILLSILTTHDVGSVKETWFDYRQRQMVHLYELHPASFSMGTDGTFSGGKAVEIWISPVYTSTSSYVFLACQGQFQLFIFPFLLHKSIDKISEVHSVAEFSVLVRFNVDLFLIPETNCLYLRIVLGYRLEGRRIGVRHPAQI